jgi:hypothetical protein
MKVKKDLEISAKEELREVGGFVVPGVCQSGCQTALAGGPVDETAQERVASRGAQHRRRARRISFRILAVRR